MADNKVNSGLLEFSEDQKVFVALDAETSEVKKAVTIDGGGVETDIAGGGGGVTVEALSVTENGTYSEEGKAYSPVTVNVSSDFSLATVEVVENTGSGFRVPNLIYYDEEDDNVIPDPDLGSGEWSILLYKGTTTTNRINPPEGYQIASAAGTGGVTVENGLGSAKMLTITGPGTLTVELEQI